MTAASKDEEFIDTKGRKKSWKLGGLLRNKSTKKTDQEIKVESVEEEAKGAVTYV